jgi:hypothetical protein
MMAYWYIGDRNNKHLGKELQPNIGDVHIWPYIIKLCESGLHASLDAMDAKKYRDGTLCRVACSGWMQIDRDKLVCSRREIVEILKIQ